MGRNRRHRWVYGTPVVNFFGPRGVSIDDLAQINLNVEELEAIKWADFEGLYQEEAARKMNISRQTFGRILEEAHKKIAECLVQGKALRIDGGNYVMIQKGFKCYGCGYTWGVPRRVPRPPVCPQCESANIHRSNIHRGFGRQNLIKGGD